MGYSVATSLSNLISVFVGPKRKVRSLVRARVRRLRLESLERRDTPSGLDAVSGSIFAATIQPTADGHLEWIVSAPRGSAPVVREKFGLASIQDRGLAGALVEVGKINSVITRPGPLGLMEWFVNRNGDPAAEIAFSYGFSTDTTLIGDPARVGRSIPVVVRNEANGSLGWYGTLDFNSTAEIYFQYGQIGGKPLLADVNGDRKIDRVVAYALPNGLLRWEADTDNNQITDWVFAEYGWASDEITTVDGNGDGKQDIAVFRRFPDGSWHLLVNLNGDNAAELDYLVGGPNSRPVVLPAEPVGDFATDSFRGAYDWQQGTTSRGYTIKPPVLLDAGALDRLQADRVNLLRVMLIKEPGSPADYGTWLAEQLAPVSQALQALKQRGLSIIIDLHTAPGSALAGERARTDGPFTSAIYRQQYLDTWRIIAQRFTDTDVVVGFDLLNEPHANSASAWNVLAKEAHDAIRAMGGRNGTRTIVIESRYGHAGKITELRPSDFVGSNVIFSFHAYDPLNFTHYGIDSDFRQKSFSSSVKKAIDSALNTVRNWQKRNQVRIFVGEFAASFPSGADTARRQAVADFLDYSTAKFESFGWQWTYHAFRESSFWDLEANFGADDSLWARSNVRRRFANNPAVF